MRLFICLDCKSIDEVPDYDGPMIRDPEYKREVPVKDDLLEYVIAPHKRGEHRGNLLQISDDDWAVKEKRDEIVKSIKEGVAKHTGMDPEAYAMRNTFQEEAAKCYEAHRRPQDGCIDWHDRSKRIGNSMLSDEERDEARSAGLKRIKQRYLCDFCVVATQHVQRKQFEKLGYYDN